MTPTVIYKWPDKQGHLVDALLPDATYLHAEPGETGQTVLEKLTCDCQRFWFHLNCTITSNFPTSRSDLLAALSDRGVQVVNGHVTDISKRYIQRFNHDHGFPDVSAKEDGDPDEMVIVKSNQNYAGGPEQRLSEQELALLGMKQSETVPAGFEYRVGTRSSFDPACWKNPSLVCERFVHNPHGIYYRAWVWGPKMAISQFHNPAPIKKVRMSTRMQTTLLRRDDASGVSGVIPSLVSRFAAAFRLDYGAVDIVTDLKGVATVIDVNSTPWNSNQPSVVAHLAD